MTNWHKRFMELAKHVSTWSKDPSTQVGCVIVDGRKRVVGLGYNGFPRGVVDDENRLANRSEKYPRIVHAEVNAILNANKSVDGCSLYVWPLAPCNECAKAIINAGIAEVYIPMMEAASNRWSDSNKLAFEMFGEASVSCFNVNMED